MRVQNEDFLTGSIVEDSDELPARLHFHEAGLLAKTHSDPSKL